MLMRSDIIPLASMSASSIASRNSLSVSKKVLSSFMKENNPVFRPGSLEVKIGASDWTLTVELNPISKTDDQTLAMGSVLHERKPFKDSSKSKFPSLSHD